jgi:hypothetical protein
MGDGWPVHPGPAEAQRPETGMDDQSMTPWRPCLELNKSSVS